MEEANNNQSTNEVSQSVGAAGFVIPPPPPSSFVPGVASDTQKSVEEEAGSERREASGFGSKFVSPSPLIQPTSSVLPAKASPLETDREDARGNRVERDETREMSENSSQRDEKRESAERTISSSLIQPTELALPTSSLPLLSETVPLEDSPTVSVPASVIAFPPENIVATQPSASSTIASKQVSETFSAPIPESPSTKATPSIDPASTPVVSIPNPKSPAPASLSEVSTSTTASSEKEAPSTLPTPAPSNPNLSAETDAESEPVQLPELNKQLFDFLNSDRVKESESILRRDFSLTEDDVAFLVEMDRAVFGGVIDTEQYVVALRGEFPHLNDEERNRLIGILLAYRYVPFGADLARPAEEVAKRQGIALPKLPYYRVYVKPMTFRGAAHEVAMMAGIEFMGQTQERLRDLIISRMKGIRSDAKTEEQLHRSIETGGLGLSEEKAKATREAMVDVIGRAELVTEEEYTTWLNAKRHRETKAENTRSDSPLKEDEEKEIQEISKASPQKREELSTAVDIAVAQIMKQLSWTPSDAYLERRLTNIISTRLRDVRSKSEVIQKLMRDDKVGGLGLDREKADKVSNEIELGYESYHGVVADEEKRQLEMQMTEQKQKIEERKKKEAEDHARWYQEKVKARQEGGQADANPFSRLRVFAQGQTSPIHPLDQKERARERADFGNLVPASSSGAGKTSLPSPVKVSAETDRLRTEASTSRPRIMDVAPPVMRPMAEETITGPLQEVGSMTLDRFRRLGGSPQASANRIAELIGLLEQESFEKKILGIQAWKSSPLQKQYLSLVAEAFMSRKPVKDLLVEKASTGESVPNSEEMDAVISLDQALNT